MSILQWKIETKEGASFQGEVNTFTGGEIRIVQKLPQGAIKQITAEMLVSVTDDARIFMNGYQSWTYVPERRKDDRIRGLMLMHQALVDKHMYDRYGDYHFVEYPFRRGVTHGFTYCYFREGERFQLIASLDERPGYTMFKYDSGKQRLYIERDCKGVACGNEPDGFHAFDLFFAIGTEEQVFDAYFQAMGIKPRTQEKLAGYCSWYNHYQNINEDIITHDLEGAATILEQGDVFLIDDGWEEHVGDWTPDAKKFPDGMKAMVDKIHEKGLRAGLWLAPFVAEKASKLYKEHPEWILLRKGEQWCCGENWSFFYALDIDHPEVKTFIEELFQTVFDEWGVDLVKLDFLYAGAPYRTETEARAGKMYRAAEWLRDLCGDHPVIASGVPLAPAFGRFEYCRIGPDVTLDWDDRPFMKLAHRERASTRHAIDNMITRRQLDGRAFLSDPDIFFLRNDNLRLNESEKLQLYEACVEYGSVLMTSDDMGAYDDNKRALYQDIRATWEQKR